jgi:UDP-glucose 4-epimerase
VGVLVTGAAGYVGRAVVDALRRDGRQVVALVRGQVPPFPPDVRVCHADITDEAALRGAVGSVDAVCHLAAFSRVREAAADPLHVYRVNLAGTLNLLAACDASRWVFASTASVYGHPRRQPVAEDAPLAPANPYAASKVAAEQVLGWQAATGRLGGVVLRLFNAAGAGDPDRTRIIPRVLAVAAGREPSLPVNGDGGAVRDFVHVADVARAAVLALGAARQGRCEVYNVGAVPASVLDIVRVAERLAGRPVPVEHLPAHPGEVRELRADTSRIRSELGWKPGVTTLEELVRGQMDDSWLAGH